jgi:hypothetical protein
MKMLFFSSEHAEVETLRQEFVEAGIPCEVHGSEVPEGVVPAPHDEELWIQRDEDCYRALMLCIHLGVGFAKPAARKPSVENAPADDDPALD